MKKLIVPARRALVPLLLLAGVLAWPVSRSVAQPAARPATGVMDYEEPKALAGDILALGGTSKKLLFRFRRAASRTGATVNVSREYTYPDGSLAVRSLLRYEAGQLVSMQTEQFQTGEKGVAVIRADPKDPARRRIYFEYTIGQGSKARKSTDTEALEKDTLADDMIPGFIVSHWDALMNGAALRFRFMVLNRKETVGFKLVKESETLQRGTPVVRLRMEPTSFIIAQLVDPVFFIVEKKAPHRILEYIGRTTPLLKEGNQWKDLDADTVFEWK